MGGMMVKQFEPNDDWIKREEGRIPTKGAAAAERASNGIGTLSDDDALVALGIDPAVIGPRIAAKAGEPDQ
jgi:hypothetical protein